MLVIRVTFTFPNAHHVTCFLKDFRYFSEREELRAETVGLSAEVVGPAAVASATIAATPAAFAAWIIPLALDHGTVFS